MLEEQRRRRVGGAAGGEDEELWRQSITAGEGRKGYSKFCCDEIFWVSKKSINFKTPTLLSFFSDAEEDTNLWAPHIQVLHSLTVPAPL